MTDMMGADVRGVPFGHVVTADTPGPRNWLRDNAVVVVLAWLLCALASALLGLSTENPFLGLGPDPDDVMRAVQLRDLIEGQGWWDTHQARLGSDGTDMHWSRLADLPYLLIAWPLSFVMGTERALMWAGSIVPGLVSGLFALGLLRGMGALMPVSQPKRLPLIAAGVAALHILAFPPRYGFGAFDHHHIQIGLLAIAVGYSLVARPSRRDAAIVALACAASATIGLESAPLVVAVCGIWALRWAFEDGREDITFTFGVTLAVAALAGLFLFTDSDGWSLAQCDGYGAPVAALLVAGGAALAIGPRFVLSRPAKLGLLAALGVACLAGLKLLAPACLGNPMDALPVEVREGWLANVSEAQSLLSGRVAADTLFSMVGVPLVAGALGLAAALRARGELRLKWAVLSGLTLFALALTLYQVRFYTFAMVLAAIIMATLLVRVLEWERLPDGRAVSPLLRLPALLAVLLGSSAASFGLLGTALAGEAETPTDADPAAAAVESAVCNAPDVMDGLTALPPGRMWTGLDIAPDILLRTSHTVVAGNYHRGHADIARWLVMNATPPSEAAMRLRGEGVDYVLICDGGISETGYAARYPGGMLKPLLAGQTVPGLAPVALDLPQGVRLYAVAP